LATGHAQLGENGHHQENYAESTDELLERPPKEQTIKRVAVQGVKGNIEAHQAGARFFQEKCADAVVD
jgi:hypothetical protein